MDVNGWTIKMFYVHLSGLLVNWLNLLTNFNTNKIYAILCVDNYCNYSLTKGEWNFNNFSLIFVSAKVFELSRVCELELREWTDKKMEYVIHFC